MVFLESNDRIHERRNFFQPDAPLIAYPTTCACLALPLRARLYPPSSFHCRAASRIKNENIISQAASTRARPARSLSIACNAIRYTTSVDLRTPQDTQVSIRHLCVSTTSSQITQGDEPFGHRMHSYAVVLFQSSRVGGATYTAQSFAWFEDACISDTPAVAKDVS